MSKCKTKCSNILGTHPSLCFLCSINYSLTVCSLYGLLSVSWNAMWGFDFLLFPFIWSRHIKEIERGLLCNTILSAPLYVHSNFWAVYGTLKCWQSESSFSSSALVQQSPTVLSNQQLLLHIKYLPNRTSWLSPASLKRFQFLVTHSCNRLFWTFLLSHRLVLL